MIIFAYASNTTPGLIICRICYNTDNWELNKKYLKRFVAAGVKLRQTSFDTLMEFSAKTGEYVVSFLFDFTFYLFV